MPTYVYECKECAQQTELIQKVSDPPLESCPSCHGAVRKVLFPVGIVFKGPGFYVTDYKHKEEKRKSGGKESSSAGDSASATAGSSVQSSSDSASSTSEPKKAVSASTSDKS